MLMLLFLLIPSVSEAKDIWIDSYNGMDCYIIEDTIYWSSDVYVELETKLVRNGKCIKIIDWELFTFRGKDGYRANDGAGIWNGDWRGLAKKIYQYCREHRY